MTNTHTFNFFQIKYVGLADELNVFYGLANIHLFLKNLSFFAIEYYNHIRKYIKTYILVNKLPQNKTCITISKVKGKVIANS